MNLRTALAKSALSGLLLAALAAALVVGLALLGFSSLAGLAIAFGTPTAALLNSLIPAAALYSVFPEGGGPAFVGMALLGAVIQLFLICAASSYVVRFGRV